MMDQAEAEGIIAAGDSAGDAAAPEGIAAIDGSVKVETSPEGIVAVGVSGWAETAPQGIGATGVWDGDGPASEGIVAVGGSVTVGTAQDGINPTEVSAGAETTPDGRNPSGGDTSHPMDPEAFTEGDVAGGVLSVAGTEPEWSADVGISVGFETVLDGLNPSGGDSPSTPPPLPLSSSLQSYPMDQDAAAEGKAAGVDEAAAEKAVSGAEAALDGRWWGRRAWELLSQVRARAPLVQCITNMVSMDLMANALLAAGASPAMVHSVQEIPDFTPRVDALLVNIGTLSDTWLPSMRTAAAAASAAGRPWVLDPVAVSASDFRMQACLGLLELRPTVVRGNASEIIALSSASRLSDSKGVDSSHESTDAGEAAKSLAREIGAIVAVSGAVDFITDGQLVVGAHNGVAMLQKITATGCAVTAVIAAFVAIHPSNALEATACALSIFGLAAELGMDMAKGPASLRVHMIDSLHGLDEHTVSSRVSIAQAPSNGCLTDYTSTFETKEIFKSRQAMINWAYETGRAHGFVIVIATSVAGAPGKKPRVTFGCERGGSYRPRKKKSEEEKDDTKNHKPKRARVVTGTKKCGCPFTLKGLKLPTADDWVVKVACGVHNHPAAKHVDGHSYAGRLTEEQTAILVDMSTSLARPREILATLKQKDPLNCTTIHTIYNARSRHRLVHKAVKSQTE